MLVKNNSALPSETDPPVCDIAVRTSVASMDDYIAIIKKDIDAGRLNMKDKFVVTGGAEYKGRRKNSASRTRCRKISGSRTYSKKSICLVEKSRSFN